MRGSLIILEAAPLPRASSDILESRYLRTGRTVEGHGHEGPSQS